MLVTPHATGYQPVRHGRTAAAAEEWMWGAGGRGLSLPARATSDVAALGILVADLVEDGLGLRLEGIPHKPQMERKS